MQGCQGYAPRYSTSQKSLLRQALFAARHILLDCFGTLEDSRTGQDTIPWMLQVRGFFLLFFFICIFFPLLGFWAGPHFMDASGLLLILPLFSSSCLSPFIPCSFSIHLLPASSDTSGFSTVCGTKGLSTCDNGVAWPTYCRLACSFSQIRVELSLLGFIMKCHSAVSCNHWLRDHASCY